MTPIKMSLQLCLMLAARGAVVYADQPAAPADDDPVLAAHRQMYQQMPVGKGDRQNNTGEPTYNPPPAAAANHYDVPYLGDWRDKLYRVGLDHRDARAKAGHPFGLEWRTRLDVHVPPGEGPFPTLVRIHGGAYEDGHKQSGGWMSRRDLDLYKAGLGRGYVVVSINYLLGHGIHPQVQRDVKEMVRFLRAHAEQYKIDPHRIALIGTSAGGWLAGSSGLTTADDLAYDGQRFLPSPGDPEKRKRAKDPKRLWPIPVPADETRPRHPGYSARVNLILADFWHGWDCGSPDDPHAYRFANPDDTADRNGTRTLGSGLVVTTVELSKKGTHVPDNDQRVQGPDGRGEMTLFERTMAFLDTHLKGDQARSPAPEARPNVRVFAESAEVTFKAPGATGWQVRMQTAGVDSPDVPEGAAHNKIRESHLTEHGEGALNGLPAFAEGETCTIRGTPLKPGWTAVLVAAVRDDTAVDEIAGTRLYMLRIDP